jgi:hypothetical protein
MNRREGKSAAQGREQWQGRKQKQIPLGRAQGRLSTAPLTIRLREVQLRLNGGSLSVRGLPPFARKKAKDGALGGCRRNAYLVTSLPP